MLYNTISMKNTNELITQRLEKLKVIKKSGVYPYGGKYVVTTDIKPLLNTFHKDKRVIIAGRVMAKRGHGKTSFGNLQDMTGKIQFYIKRDEIGEERFNLFKKVDIGDIIGIEGTLFKTHTDEITVKIVNFSFLSKSIRPLPEKWHGLKDVETRYRRRYLDLIMNEKVKDVFVERSLIIKSIRNYLDDKKFLEVETPMMQSIPGGAVAKPFITHHNALNMNLFLRIAPELYLKRLLVGGFERVYEINRNFRNEGLSRRHNPEFTMLEVYAAYWDYNDMMNLVEEMILMLVKKLGCYGKMSFGDKKIDLTSEWKRIKFYDALQEYTGMDLRDLSLVEKAAKKVGVKIEKGQSLIDILNNIFEKVIEPELVNPTFIIDYPAFLCPLSKTKINDSQLTDRFELYIGCQEIANAYSELNDPIEQLTRFKKQLKDSELKDKGEISKVIDEDFVMALEYGMPPAAGLGIGIDRLVMLLTQQSSIRDVILFPQLKSERKTEND